MNYLWLSEAPRFLVTLNFIVAFKFHNVKVIHLWQFLDNLFKLGANVGSNSFSHM